jgi:hypothetical protein
MGRSRQSLKSLVAGFLPASAKESFRLRGDMLDICKDLIAHGEFNDAAAVLGKIIAVDQGNSLETSVKARRMLGLCKQLKQSGLIDEVVSYGDILERLQIGRHDPDYAMPDGVLVRPTEGATDALIVFTPHDGDFWISINLLHHHLKAFPWHIVYLRDAKGCFHMAGLHGLGDDYPACLTGLNTLLDGLGVQNIYTMGGSVGGYAALRYGLDLKARGVLAFSAASTLEPSTWPEAYRPALVPIRDKVPHMAVELDHLYRIAEQRPRTLLCYGDQSDFDVAQANRMTGIEGVRHIPIAGYANHDAISYMVVNKKMGLIHNWLTGDGDASFD